MCGGGGGGGVSRSSNVQRTQPRMDITRPEVKRQREDPFANDTMEGLRAADIKKVAKPVADNSSLLDKIKKQLPDVSSIVDDVKKKIFPNPTPPVAAPPAATAPVTTNPVRVV